jgi:hypothetical protein
MHEQKIDQCTFVSYSGALPSWSGHACHAPCMQISGRREDRAEKPCRLYHGAMKSGQKGGLFPEKTQGFSMTIMKYLHGIT